MSSNNELSFREIIDVTLTITALIATFGIIFVGLGVTVLFGMCLMVTFGSGCFGGLIMIPMIFMAIPLSTVSIYAAAKFNNWAGKALDRWRHRLHA